MKKCVACGSDQLTEGSIFSGGAQLLASGFPIEYKPNESRTKFSIFGESCLNCGHLQMYIDQERLRKYIKN